MTPAENRCSSTIVLDGVVRRCSKEAGHAWETHVEDIELTFPNGERYKLTVGWRRIDIHRPG